MPNTRRNPVFTVPGGGGPINPKGVAPFDRDVNIITYQFQINPLAAHAGVDVSRSAFLRQLDHGIPQILAFRDDNNEVWFATCAIAATPHHQMASSDASHTIQASWVMLTDYLSAPAAPGIAVYGLYNKYGQHARYGALAVRFPLPAALNWLDVDNSISHATAATMDPIVTLSGPFGSKFGAANGGGTAPIMVGIYPAAMGFYVWYEFRANRGDGNPDVMTIDLGSRSVLLNADWVGRATPAFQLITKFAATQWGHLMIMPDAINQMFVQLYPNSVPSTGLGGSASLQWKPKRSL